MAIDLLTGGFIGEVPVIIARADNDTNEEQQPVHNKEITEFTGPSAIDRARHELAIAARHALQKQGIDPDISEEPLDHSRNHHRRKSQEIGSKRSQGYRNPKRVGGMHQRSNQRYGF